MESYASIQATRYLSVFWCHQPPALIASCSRWVRDMDRAASRFPIRPARQPTIEPYEYAVNVCAKSEELGDKLFRTGRKNWPQA